MLRGTAAALILGAAALGGCGGGDDPPPQPDLPPAQLLREAARDPVPRAVATIQLDYDLEGSSALAGDGFASLHGPYELDGEGALPSFDFDLDANVAGFGLDGKLVSTGEDAFVVFFGENYRAGPDLVGRARRMLPVGGLDVASWIRNPRYAGPDDVAGARTERIEGRLDPAAAAGLIPGAGPGPVSAWVASEDDTLRRVSAQLPYRAPPGSRAAALGVTRGTVAIDAQISSVGSEAEIAPPPGGGFQPLERLIERIRGLAGLAL